MFTGGAALPGDGFFIQPTILRNTTADMKVVREEIFGPVLSAATFRDSDSVADIVARANDSIYGLSSTIWTRDMSRAH